MEEQATRLRRLKVGRQEHFGQYPCGGSCSGISLIAQKFCVGGGTPSSLGEFGVEEPCEVQTCFEERFCDQHRDLIYTS